MFERINHPLVNFNLPCRYSFFLVLMILGPLLEPVSAVSQETVTQSGVSVEVNVDPPQASIGDIITFSILVRHDSILVPEMPKIEMIPGFEIVESGSREPESFAGQIESEFWVRLRTESVGTLTIPSIPVSLYAEGRSSRSDPSPATVMTPQVTVEVQSVLRLQGEPTEIRDIKPLIEIEPNRWPMVAGILALLLFLVAAFLFWRKRQRKPGVQETRSERKLLPHELALQELETLRAKRLVESGKIQQYYFGLSEIFRRYLESRYRFPALDWTTEEITQNLHRVTELKPELKERLSMILRNTDQVKFAKAQVTHEENETQAIIQFIKVTRFIPSDIGRNPNSTA